jgi:hypothetical protein
LPAIAAAGLEHGSDEPGMLGASQMRRAHLQTLTAASITRCSSDDREPVGAGYRLSGPSEIDPLYIPERTVPLPASAMPPLHELLRRCSERTADAHLAERVRAEIRHALEAT